MLCIERAATSAGAYTAWRRLAQLCGWDVPDRKSPPPSACFTAVGVLIDLSPLPASPALVRITPERCKNLCNELKSIHSQGLLQPGQAGRVDQAQTGC